MDPIDLNLRVGRLPAALAPTGGQLSAAEVDENFTNLKTAAEQLNAEKAPLAKWISATAPSPLLYTDWYLLDGTHLVWDGTVWFEPPGTPGADGIDGIDGVDGVAATPQQATLTVSPVAIAGYAEVVVSVVGVTATSIIRASLVGELDAENDLEELADSGMRVVGVPETGQIRFVLTGNSAFVGPFKVIYEVFTP
jgi:hypothetical protein